MKTVREDHQNRNAPPKQGLKNKRSNVAAPDSLSKIKKRIRDYKRLLNKGAGNAKIKVQTERRLRALEYELGEKMIDERERKMSKKYHGVRHFERKKVLRKLRSKLGELDATKDPEQKAEIEAEIQELQLDQRYIDNYPMTLPYVALFPTTNADDPESTKKRNAIRERVRQALENEAGDFSDMRKEYRSKYRNILVKQGSIPEAKPLADEEEEGAVVDEVEEQANSDEDIREADDFFE
ncbi:uncharacterized protein BYT42DRAFT_607945 [Radiomyces spectabilis]|uniref:uncharacterized protein n=1 Tax=Radiomyces spectabilis TaxID=64574 RepID=UPI00221F98DA|nr:uncharacterized protein BYT42DRAFT_607945 [Radiomyces spectabilis]KAI8369576.1 hypothetical protein BYT42DRAFT_607945 [Radiomyces spectabilis]